MSGQIAAETLAHRDAVADTGDAYTAFHGWRLSCLWCDYYSIGRTKSDALEGMQRHYDRFGMTVHSKAEAASMRRRTRVKSRGDGTWTWTCAHCLPLRDFAIWPTWRPAFTSACDHAATHTEVTS